MEALRRLLRRGRAFLARARPEFLRAVAEAFHPAPVPAVDALRPARAAV
jgi:hypothetical protein